MGMSANEATIVRKLYNAEKLNHNLFTMCFQRHDYYEKEVRGGWRGASVYRDSSFRSWLTPF